ncbi:ammonium transporter [Sphingomonas sp. HITSZ_GF]|uniref:ammonium transporter n=1 Tax=Sphingomonas sp. HITSZ_GF TaxID=3037247 RepID=UPI00240E2FBE|nr:ammonium transporter [Sphingomonas sp. HITSZ_GF]MDG2535869.1 ammonium transporter [Sphingomonas sp. HITSZ_GF]
MNKELMWSLRWGVGIVVLALGATMARKLGYIEAETAMRLAIGGIGVMTAAMGNRIPKTVVPGVSVYRAQRVAGWSMTLAGLVYAGLWAFAPIQLATFGGMGALLIAMAVTFGYCLSLRDSAKAA